MKLSRLLPIVALLALLLPLGSAPAQNLPDAPGQKILDRSFILGHAVYGAANAFDGYITARNVGTCAFEGNPDLGRNPSSKAVAVHSAVEFGLVLAADAGFKWLGRRQGVPRWLNSLGGNLGAGIGTFKHVRGGMGWVRDCY